MNQKKRISRKTSAKKKTKHGPPGTPLVDFLGTLRSMEGDMAAIGGLLGGRKRSAADEAQDLIYKAWESPTRARAVALAEKALEISPDCADAYVLLAQETARTADEAIELYRKGIEAGKRALGRKAFKDDVGYFWGILETRPYMRALCGLAQTMWGAGQRESAVDHYWELLHLNPNDNQGIRDLLMSCLLELGRDTDAERLFKQYEDDGMAVWAYSRALLDFRKHGASQVAANSLRAAIRVNRHVPAYLRGGKKMPRRLPDHYGYGDDNEAILYVYGNRSVWESTSGAIEWLTAKIGRSE